MRIIDTRFLELKHARVDILGPAMRTLRATPVVIVPAQGQGTFIELVEGFASFAYFPGATQYVDSADDMALRIWDGSSGYTFSANIDASEMITPATSQVTVIGATITTFYDYAASSLLNYPLVIHNIGNNEYTGNDENLSVFTVEVTYRVHPMYGTPTSERPA